MYEDLVKRLRNRANGSFEEKCEGCEYTEDFPPCAHCTIKAFNEAADAIEELEKLTDAQLDIIKQYQVYLTKPHWIPVTERLPDCQQGAEVGNIEWVIRGRVYAGCFGRGGIYRDAYFRTWTDGTEGIDAKDADYWRAVSPPEPPKEET